MTTPISNPALGEVRTAILTMARRLEDASELPQEGIADLKNAVDDVRIRLWGVLMAGDSTDYKGFVGRFRMRRAAECCRGIEEDVAAGRIPTDSLEARQLLAAARHLANRLGPEMPAGRA
jgi:hypothetical protein